MTYFLPNDIARCSRDDCPLHLECARWLDRLPFESYWYSQFERKGARILLRRRMLNTNRKEEEMITVNSVSGGKHQHILQLITKPIIMYLHL